MIHNLHKTNQENSSSLPQTQLPGLPLGNEWQSLPQCPIVFPHHPFIDGPSLISKKRIAKKSLISCSHQNHSAFPSPFSENRREPTDIHISLIMCGEKAAHKAVPTVAVTCLL